MATKAQAVSALKKHSKGAILMDDSNLETYHAMIEAPKGHHWDGHVHCHCVGEASKGVDVENKGEYWDSVIDDIQNLPPAVLCDDDDCEGIREFGVCEYWENE